MTLILQAKASLQNASDAPRITSVSVKPFFELDTSFLNVFSNVDSIVAAGTGTTLQRTLNLLSGDETKSKPGVVYDATLKCNVLSFNGSQNIKTATFANANTGLPVTVAVLVKAEAWNASRVITVGTSLQARKIIANTAIGYGIAQGSVTAKAINNNEEDWQILIVKYDTTGAKYISKGVLATRNDVFHEDTTVDVINLASDASGGNSSTIKLAYASVTCGNLSDTDLMNMYQEIRSMFSL